MMTLHSMNHQQAIDSMAVERYVLGEMTATDRQAFEEHYFNCPECLEAITFASDFIEAGREYIEPNREPAQVPTPVWYKRVFSTSGWFSPVPAFASAVFLVLFGLSTYQGIELAQVKKSLRTPSVVATSVFLPLSARGAGDARGAELPMVNVERNQAFQLDLDLPQHDQYSSYEGEIISKSGSAGISTFTLPTDRLNQTSRVELAVPPTLPEGTYQFIIRGTNNGAKEKATIARYDFVLKFKS
jgi:hypothetical protein